MLEVEKITGVRLESYYLYDRITKEKITENNCNKYDYQNAYDNRIKYDYLYDDALEKDPIKFLIKNKGFIYIPMLIRNQQKAYIFQFSTKDIGKIIDNLPTFNSVGNIVPTVYEQLTLPLEEIGGVVHA
jgi:hypothetical protein